MTGHHGGMISHPIEPLAEFQLHVEQVRLGLFFRVFGSGGKINGTRRGDPRPVWTALG